MGEDGLEGRGEIRLSTGPLTGKGREEAGPTHFLEVVDSGAGMSEDFVQDKLFQPFVTTKPKGLGLGMHHVQQAVVRMGGRIEVASRVGVGTRVRVELGRGKEPTGHGAA